MNKDEMAKRITEDIETIDELYQRVRFDSLSIREQQSHPIFSAILKTRTNNKKSPRRQTRAILFTGAPSKFPASGDVPLWRLYIMNQIEHKVITITYQPSIGKPCENDRPQPRPQVQPVYGICGHIARSERHTCGSYNCIQQYSY